MKKLTFMALVALLALVASCQKDEPLLPPAPTIDPVEKHGFLIMNNGNWGSNDACFTFYHGDDDITPNYFLTANGQKAGDLAQDIIDVDGTLYIAMNGSKLIYVTDKQLKLQYTIVAQTAQGDTLSPRSLIDVGKKVYATYYEGYLGEIDPAKGYAVRLTEVGASPEGLCYANGKIYVANSGGANYPNYDNTLSVVDVETFKEERKITVNVNPQQVVPNADHTVVFVSSWGDYGAAPAMLQGVSTLTDAVTDFDYRDVKSIVRGQDDNLYVVTGGYDENWQVTGTVNIFNMRHYRDLGAIIKEPITGYYSLSFAGGCIIVGTSDYTTNGDVRVFDMNGNHITTIDAQGLNPQKVIYL